MFLQKKQMDMFVVIWLHSETQLLQHWAQMGMRIYFMWNIKRIVSSISFEAKEIHERAKSFVKAGDILLLDEHLIH